MNFKKNKQDEKKPYIIWAPEYQKSNGAKILYKLSKYLQDKGYETYISSWPPYTEGYNYIYEIDDEMRKNAIVVYPEVVRGNPLNIGRVARYVLYYSGELGGDKEFDKKEAVFTWLPKYYPEAPVLRLPFYDTSLFYDDNSLKKQDCCFVHKNGKWKDVKETQGLVEINMKWPESRKELADLLRTTGTLYSYDNASAVLDEAILCGAKVKIITEAGFEDYEILPEITPEELDFQLNRFIETTQKLDCKSLKYEKISLSKKLFSLTYENNYKILRLIGLKIKLSKNDKRPGDSLETWQEYLRRNKTVKKIYKKLNKYKNKRVLLYGTGLVTQALMKEDCNLIKNFYAVSDKKITETNKKGGLNIPEIPPSKINEAGIDVIFVSAYKFDIIEKDLKDAGIKCKIEKII